MPDRLIGSFIPSITRKSIILPLNFIHYSNTSKLIINTCNKPLLRQAGTVEIAILPNLHFESEQ